MFLLRQWSINSYTMITIFLIIGIITVFGFLCVFQAYRIGSPPSVAPFEYIIILWGLIISWIIWDQTLSIWGYIGLFLIVCGGTYTYLRELQKKVKVTIDKPLN